ncbi:response regulator transcription factor [Glaciimonas immobilis]|uniref:Two-component system response regulator DctR n=1 Tax=Glaciimonas immobilis TaxID=728004 RepID=A0A840RU93_9BURK|nr:response regulator [Glaciimonas immobilis]KAF3997667.1 response regulator transcription factor [Glaciimonas immobilis]MBB5200618.1 two-component system response regulator DctR [Glaciimonas immobilis]
MLHIIDDEEVIRDALSWLAQSRAIPALCYPSGQHFLDSLDLCAGDLASQKNDAQAAEGDCLLLDVRMPGMSGVALFDILSARKLTQRFPVIFLTGHGDVPMAVDTLKRGAFDFFEKPFNDNKLMDRVQEALLSSRVAMGRRIIDSRLNSLSTRERAVLDLILIGKMNKVIADQLGISMRTVEVHRAHIFDKMHVKTAVELARLLD